MGQRENRLDRKDKKLQRQFVLGVGILFLNTQSETQLYQKLNSINKEVRLLLRDLEDEGVEEANTDTEQFTKFTAEPKNNKTRRASVAMSVVSGLVYLIDQHQQEKAYHAAVQQALEEQQAKLEMTASTEFFNKYNKQYINNLAKLEGYWEWNAQLDKRTCQKCMSLAGEQWDNKDDVPPIPQHPRCRCILDFHPGE